MANSEMDAASVNAEHFEYQYKELEAAQATSSDFDYAFRLQLEEALRVSAQSEAPIEIPSVDVQTNIGGEGDEMTLLLKLQALEFNNYKQDVADRLQAVEEMQNLSQEISRKNHDAKFARSIEEMEDEEWEEFGDNFESPFEPIKEDRPFKLYFKGVVSRDDVDGDGNSNDNRWESLAGAGVAIFDPDDNLVLQMEKPLGTETSRAVAEYRALIEGLTAASTLGIRSVRAFGDCVQIHKQVTGRWRVRQHKIYNYFQEVQNLLGKLDIVLMVLLTRSENRVALSLARQAIHTQLHPRAENHHQGECNKKETCSICFEDKDSNQMYEVMTCRHRYCFFCMSQHVEVKLRHGFLPVCPYEGCKTSLTVDDCKKFLSSKWIEVLTKRLEEAVIPDSDKVYCPYSNCSALMTKGAVDRSLQACSSSNPFEQTECLKCRRYFCIECRVPWHANMSCQQYQRHAPQLYGVDAKLHLLANNSRWRRCEKCKHMIELAEGCNHITCRCGFEFCYVCGAEWKNKKQTCNCLLWDERNIIRQPLIDEYESEDEDYYDSEEEYESEDEDFYESEQDVYLVI